jgi:hypothetical protein
MPSGGVRRGKDIVPDPRTRPASLRARRRALRGEDVRRERARRRARGLQRERRIAVAPVDIRRRRLGLRGDRALQRRGEAAQRVGARAGPAERQQQAAGRGDRLAESRVLRSSLLFLFLRVVAADAGARRGS